MIRTCLLDSNVVALRQAALTALQSYPDEKIGVEVTKQYAALPEDVRAAAQSLPAGRKTWAMEMKWPSMRGRSSTH